MPYTQECNDVAMMLIQHHPAREYFERARDQFEQIYADAADGARVMALVQHPYILGAPHRLKYFRADHRDDRGEAGCAALDRQPDRGLVYPRDLVAVCARAATADVPAAFLLGGGSRFALPALRVSQLRAPSPTPR